MAEHVDLETSAGEVRRKRGGKRVAVVLVEEVAASLPFNWAVTIVHPVLPEEENGTEA